MPEGVWPACRCTSSARVASISDSSMAPAGPTATGSALTSPRRTMPRRSSETAGMIMTVSSSSERQPQQGLATGSVLAVLDGQRAAMGFCDLAAEHQPDAGATRLRREERDEQVRDIGKPRAFILNEQVDVRRVLLPAYPHAAARFQRRIGGVSHQVDEKLLYLVPVGLDGHARAGGKLHTQTRLESRDPAQQDADVERLQLRLGQSRESCVA